MPFPLLESRAMPLLDIFWTMLGLFLFIAWLWVLFSVITDLFRNDAMSGGVKALWVLFVIVLPALGVLVYLLMNGDGMARRTNEHAAAVQEASRTYIREAAGTPSVAGELSKLAELRDSGTISDQEFADQKSRLLA